MTITLDISVYRIIAASAPDYEEDDIRILIDGVNDIWRKAGIEFRCHFVRDFSLGSLGMRDVYEWLASNISILQPENASPINVYFAKWSQDKPNGLRRENAVMIRTDSKLQSALGIDPSSITLNPHVGGLKAVIRVTAHELGHVLRGPGHPQGPHLLMSQGFDGTFLPNDEIQVSRRGARKFIT